MKDARQFRSCKRSESANKSWYRSSRCLGIFQTTYKNMGLIWSKPHVTVASLTESFQSVALMPFQITIPVVHVTDVEFARCASCRSTSRSTSEGQFYRLSLWPCHPQAELKQLKEQKELQQDHAERRGEGLVMLSAKLFVPWGLAQNGPTQFKLEPVWLL